MRHTPTSIIIVIIAEESMTVCLKTHIAKTTVGQNDTLPNTTFGRNLANMPKQMKPEDAQVLGKIIYDRKSHKHSSNSC